MNETDARPPAGAPDGAAVGAAVPAPGMPPRTDARSPGTAPAGAHAPNAALVELVAGAQACRRCPAMEGRRRVLGTANGRFDAPVMILAEAPGRFGGDRTGVPLVSDASGRHFTQLIEQAAIRRDDLFISNAVLCNPRDAAGHNRRPSRGELEQCRDWLRRQIEVIDAAVIVTLGATALAALGALTPHGYRLQSHRGMPLAWAGRIVIPLYHPSPLTRASRTDAQQEADYRRVAAYLRGRGLIAPARLTEHEADI